MHERNWYIGLLRYVATPVLDHDHPTYLTCLLEIQDIIKDQKPDIIHDKEAAVNYFTYEHKDSNSKRSVDGNDLVQRDNANNQWVSFDDKTTMKQKVDWANKLG